MKHFIIITNREKDPELEVTKRVESFLMQRGCTCSIYSEERSSGQWIQKPAERKASGILVLGGDGTLLKAAEGASCTGIPVLGINLGTMGYLAEVERSNLEQALAKLVEGDYVVEERMMLSGQVLRQGEVLEDTCALNDITITRNGHLQMLFFQIFVNGRLLKEYHADGIILATPTGSTGYNMSAGGPIVEPGAKLILLTPICPHTLQTRSVILRAEDEIAIRVKERGGREKQDMEACFDGSKNLSLRPGDEVRISRSPRVTPIIKLSEASFLEVLHRKLSE
ncbi:MAG: NAD(+) kinase [Clostridiales bacterium]|nr:MAG: NAD(+) kinase [Clostridiales bacterium]